MEQGVVQSKRIRRNNEAWLQIIVVQKVIKNQNNIIQKNLHLTENLRFSKHFKASDII